MYTCYIQSFNILANRFCSWSGWFGILPGSKSWKTCFCITGSDAYNAASDQGLHCLHTWNSFRNKITRGPRATTLTWMYSYEGYIQPKNWKCCTQEKLTFRLPWQSAWATAIKNNIFVEANVMNTYAKFQLHLPYGMSEEKIFEYFSKIYPLCCHGNQSNSAIWTKFIWIIEDYSRNISVKKKKSKYLQWDSKNCQFPLFPL